MAQYLYCLTFPNGKNYVGITVDPHKREIGHLSQSNTGREFFVNAAIRKYGMPRLKIMCVSDDDYIKDLEVRAIAIFQTYKAEFGYNLSLGRHRSTPETRAKISTALMGHPGAFVGRRHTPEARAKSSSSNRGQTRSPETRAKMSAKAKNRPPRPQSEAERNKRRSPEFRAMLSAKAKQRLPPSSETRAKMSAAGKDRLRSPEELARIAKLGAGKKGQPSPFKGIQRGPYQSRGVSKSPEHRANLIAAMLRNGLIPANRTVAEILQQETKKARRAKGIR